MNVFPKKMDCLGVYENNKSSRRIRNDLYKGFNKNDDSKGRCAYGNTRVGMEVLHVLIYCMGITYFL